MSAPRRYRKRPVVIEARQVDSQDYDGLCDLVEWCGGRAVGWDGHLVAIDTLEGTMYADDGDWIIRGVAGEFYPCKPEVFSSSYEDADSGRADFVDLPWRCGGRVGRTLYVDHGDDDDDKDPSLLFGIVDTPALAAHIVEIHNWWLAMVEDGERAWAEFRAEHGEATP